MYVGHLHAHTAPQTKDGRRGGGQGRGQEWHLSGHAPKRDAKGLTAPPNHLAPCSASCSGGVATRRAQVRCMHTCANTMQSACTSVTHEPVLKTSQQIEWVILTSQMVVCRRWWRSGTSTSKCRRCHQGSHEEDRTRHGRHCFCCAVCVSFGLDFFLVTSALHCAASMFYCLNTNLSQRRENCRAETVLWPPKTTPRVFATVRMSNEL